MPTARIVAQFRKEYFHKWEGAPEQHAYLRNSHRHLLHIRVDLEVYQDDREIEFIAFGKDMARALDLAISGKLKSAPGIPIVALTVEVRKNRASCETIARLLWLLASHYVDDSPDRWVCVEVLEDGENGAVVEGVYGL